MLNPRCIFVPEYETTKSWFIRGHTIGRPILQQMKTQKSSRSRSRQLGHKTPDPLSPDVFYSWL